MTRRRRREGPTFRDFVRHFLGLDEINDQLTELESRMATEAEQLNTILGKLTDVHADVRAKLDEVRGELSPEGQAKLDEVNAALDTFDAEIGDADGSDTPPAPPAEPTL